MKKFKILLCVFVILLVVKNAFADYPNNYEWKEVCPEGGYVSAGDYWDAKILGWVERQGFFQCECTSYVADKINDVFDKNGLEQVFKNYYLQPSGYRWGNAEGWLAAALRANIDADNYPYPGAVAYWNSNHVAFVERIVYDENALFLGIDVSEYNQDPPLKHGFSTRFIHKDSSDYPDFFIHILPKHMGWSWYLDCVEMWNLSGPPFSNQGQASLSGSRVLGWYWQPEMDDPGDDTPALNGPDANVKFIDLCLCLC